MAAATRFNAKYSEKVSSFLLVKNKILEQERVVEDWISHLNTLKLDYGHIFEYAAEPKLQPHLAHYVKGYFSLLLITLDKLVHLQSGRIVKPHQRPLQAAHVHPTRLNSFHWNSPGRVLLSLISVDGYRFHQKELRKEIEQEFQLLNVSYLAVCTAHMSLIDQSFSPLTRKSLKKKKETL